MYYLLYLTERCNLLCTYCESAASRERHTPDVAYPMDALVEFLKRDPDNVVQFYGGEPLLRAELLVEVLERVRPWHAALQTNGQFLDRLPTTIFDRLDTISVSLDGPAEVTNRARGEGVYETAIMQAAALRGRGYQGRIDARMTVSPGTRIYDVVRHFVDGCAFHFDGIYWQLNMQFGRVDWRRDRHFLTRWVHDAYNPQLTRLVDDWTAAATREGKLWGIIPFAELMFDVLTGHRVHGLRCCAGDTMWAIDTNGEVFPCPVMRGASERSKGQFATLDPATLPGSWKIEEPCTACEVFGLCGGRCLCAYSERRWGPEGFNLTCETIKHLVHEVERVAPAFEKAVNDGVLGLYDLAIGADYEVIP